MEGCLETGKLTGPEVKTFPPQRSKGTERAASSHEDEEAPTMRELLEPQKGPRGRDGQRATGPVSHTHDACVV